MLKITRTKQETSLHKPVICFIDETTEIILFEWKCLIDDNDDDDGDVCNTLTVESDRLIDSISRKIYNFIIKFKESKSRGK